MVKIEICSYNEFNDTFNVKVDGKTMTLSAVLTANLCPETEFLDDLPFDLVGQKFERETFPKYVVMFDELHDDGQRDYQICSTESDGVCGSVAVYTDSKGRLIVDVSPDVEMSESEILEISRLTQNEINGYQP